MKVLKVEFSMMRLLITTDRYSIGVYPDKSVRLFTHDKALVDEIVARGDAESVRDDDGLYVVVLKNEAAGKYIPVP
jgi:hypothetical protein